jgi:catechol 2,3-dioxygenase-like lactoylglutathione lyase family enzyme
MLHHLSFAVSDLDRSGRFYDAALAPLGYARVWSDRQAIGYGLPGGGDKFALKAYGERMATPSPGFHLAFAASSRQAVDAWHAAAIAAGGTDNGKPGLRPQYGPDYYAAFVYDPDGYAIEAVTKA